MPVSERPLISLIITALCLYVTSDLLFVNNVPPLPHSPLFLTSIPSLPLPLLPSLPSLPPFLPLPPASSPPLNIGIAVGQTSLTLQWETPDMPCGVIEYYNVRNL